MRLGILQPGYLPWLGFFEQMYKSDVFVIYDNIQYDKGGWRNRNRIKTANGTQWLTVPVHVSLREATLIHEVRIDNKVNWRKKHLISIKQGYSKAPYFKKYIEIFDEVFSREWKYLVDIDLYLILKLAKCLGIGDKTICLASTLELEKTGILEITGKGKDNSNKMERLVKLCKLFEADTFFEGAAGKNYIDDSYFARHGIKIEYQDYKHPVYNQIYGEFVPYMSVIDLLFNYGEESLKVLIN